MLVLLWVPMHIWFNHSIKSQPTAGTMVNCEKPKQIDKET